MPHKARTLISLSVDPASTMIMDCGSNTFELCSLMHRGATEHEVLHNTGAYWSSRRHSGLLALPGGRRLLSNLKLDPLFDLWSNLEFEIVQKTSSQPSPLNDQPTRGLAVIRDALSVSTFNGSRFKSAE